MNTKRYISCKWLGLLAIAATTFISCEKELTDEAYEKAIGVSEDGGVIFDDAFTGGLDYHPYENSFSEGVFEITQDVKYSGTSSMQLNIPSNDLGYAGAAFIIDDGGGMSRDFTNYDVFTFWAKASTPTIVDQVGYGQAYDDGYSDNQNSLTDLLISGVWKKYAMVIPDPSLLTSEKGGFWFSDSVTSSNPAYETTPTQLTSGVTLWFDDIQFEKNSYTTYAQYNIVSGEDVAVVLNSGSTYQIDGFGGLGVTEIPTDYDPEVIIVNTTLIDLDIANYTFSSSNESIATVDDSGLITVVGDTPGQTVTISASYLGREATGSVTITITDENIPTLSIFSDEHGSTGVDPFNLFWCEWQTTLGGVEEVSEGENVLNYTQFNYVAFDIAGDNLNIGDANVLHIDVYVEDTSTLTSGIGLTFEDSFGDQTVYTVPASDLTSDGWVTLEIPINSFSNPSVFLSSSFNWMMFSEGSGRKPSECSDEISVQGETVSFDNIYFYDNGEDYSIVGTELVSNGSFDDGATGWTGNSVNVQTDGGNSYNYASVAAAGNPWDANLSYVVSITAGTSYQLSFDASTDATTGTRTITPGIGLNLSLIHI